MRAFIFDMDGTLADAMPCVVVTTTLTRAHIAAMGDAAAHVTHVIDGVANPSLNSLFRYAAR